MPERVTVDAVVLGEGLTAWIAAREIWTRGLTVAVVSSGDPTPGRDGAPPAECPRSHRPVGPLPSYLQAIRLWGPDDARRVWEVFRDDADALARLCAELDVAHALTQPGGFVLARSRAEALELAEAEDLLRDDGFSGEFLDHYLLETRFDVRNVVAAYWATDDVVVNVSAVLEALQAGGRAVERLAGPVLRVDAGNGRLDVHTDTHTVRAEWALLATAAPLLGSGLSALLRVEPWWTAGVPLGPELALPLPARSFDGRMRWDRDGDVLRTVGLGSDPESAGVLLSPGVPGQAIPRLQGTALTSPDGLPVIGRIGDAALFVACGGQGPVEACSVLGARWAVECAVTGRDRVPPRLSTRRFSASPTA